MCVFCLFCFLAGGGGVTFPTTTITSKCLNETAYLLYLRVKFSIRQALNQHSKWLSAAVLAMKILAEFECMKNKTDQRHLGQNYAYKIRNLHIKLSWYRENFTFWREELHKHVHYNVCKVKKMTSFRWSGFYVKKKTFTCIVKTIYVDYFKYLYWYHK